MIYFNCDYNEGGHPKILEALAETNLDQTPGYGEDLYCGHARALIRKACGAEQAGVHFFIGGTQVNFTVIRAALRPHQGVISPATGHINVHETGAVEATGHKVLSVPCTVEGKLTAAQVDRLCTEHYSESVPTEHMVQPKMVYISQPTENGALYSREELAALHDACKKWDLYLFADGARMGYGLTSARAEYTLEDMAKFCDVFTIGGTKCGALFGEAAVLTNPELDRDFRYAIKQNGAMLAKGRLLGLQFEALFTDGTYFEICKRANLLAEKITAACREAGFPEYAPSPTNQRFFIFPDDVLKRLEENYVFSFWKKTDEVHTAVRICTSWATAEENVNALIREIREAK